MHPPARSLQKCKTMAERWFYIQGTGHDHICVYGKPHASSESSAMFGHFPRDCTISGGEGGRRARLASSSFRNRRSGAYTRTWFGDVQETVQGNTFFMLSVHMHQQCQRHLRSNSEAPIFNLHTPLNTTGNACVQAEIAPTPLFLLKVQEAIC
jgi:hypothetical protein